MSRLSTAISALHTAQHALDVTGNNVANANTPGYHRQVVRLASRATVEFGGFAFGDGVDVQEISRVRHTVLEEIITKQRSESKAVDARLIELRTLESRLSVEETNAGLQVETLFNDLEQLSTRITDSTSRAAVITSADRLTKEFNGISREIGTRKEMLNQSIRDTLKEINSITTRIAELNGHVQRLENRKVNANDFRDQRDELVNRLADLINVQTIEQSDGQTTVLGGGGALVIGRSSNDLSLTIEDDQAQILAGNTEPTLQPTGGTLGGLVELRNVAVPGVQDRLDTLARQIITSFDGIHTRGVGLDGGFTQLTGVRPVSDVGVTLDDAELDFEPQAGSLFIGVTDVATGLRTLTEVQIDPTQQRLRSNGAITPDPTTSLVDAINQTSNITALSNSETGRLTLIADDGFRFDFTGGYDSVPDTSFLTSTTSTPTIGGLYTGPDNDTFTFRFLNSGAIGVTQGLRAEVLDLSGNVIATIDIGEGYSAGDALQVADGINVSFSAGDVTQNESFSTRVVADADTSGILAALGLNTFFQGSDATTIQVSEDLANDTRRLATSLNRDPSDNANLAKLVQLRDENLLSGGTQTFRTYYTSLVTDVALEVRELDDTQDTQKLLGDRLEAERQSISGVDPNEELVAMIKFQRMFQMAAQFITVSNRAFDEIMNLVQ